MFLFFYELISLKDPFLFIAASLAMRFKFFSCVLPDFSSKCASRCVL